MSVNESGNASGNENRNGNGCGLVGRGHGKARYLSRIELVSRGARSCSIREEIEVELIGRKGRGGAQEVV